MHLMRRFLSSAFAVSLIAMPLFAGPKPPDQGGTLVTVMKSATFF